jgi:hypothetical protein
MSKRTQHIQDDKGSRRRFVTSRSYFDAVSQSTYLKRAKSDPVSNLGAGGVFVTFAVSSFFATRVVCNLTVILLYGSHAFFDDGLRVENWKHSLLSNGATLPWYGKLMAGPTILPFCVAAVFGAEFTAKHLGHYLSRRPLWVVTVARLLGGTALVALSVWFYSEPNAFHYLHPIPLSALVAGIVLIWRAIARTFQGVT